MKFSNENSDIIVHHFEMELKEEGISEEELITLLAQQIDYLLEKRTEHFFNLMYRLDIDERKVAKALSPVSDELPAVALAKLIIERQKQKNATKAKYKSDSSDWNFDF